MPGPATDHHRRRRSRRRYSPRRVGFWLLATLVAGVLAGSLLLPTLVRTAATDFAREAFDVQLEIGTVRINPFTLSLRLTDLHAATPEGATVATAERVELTLHPASAVRRAWFFRSGTIHTARLHTPGSDDEARNATPWLSMPDISLHAGHYHAREQDLHIDTVELRQPQLRLDAAHPWPRAVPDPDGAAVRTHSPRLEISRLQAIDMGVEIVDERPDPSAWMQLGMFDVSLTDIGRHTHTPARVAVDGQFNDGGGFSLTGTVALVPATRLSGEIEVDDFPLRQFSTWMPELDILDGGLFLGGEIDIGAGTPLEYRGRMDIDDFHVTAVDDGASLLRWHRLYSERLVFSPGRQRLEAHSLTLIAPEARVRFREDGAVIIGPLRIPARAGGTPPRGAQARPMIIVGGVRIADGRLDITDPAADPPLDDVSLRALSGGLSRLATGAETPARLTLSGRRVDGAEVDIDGRVRLPARQLRAEASFCAHQPGADSVTESIREDCYHIDASGFTAVYNRRMPDR